MEYTCRETDSGDRGVTSDVYLPATWQRTSTPDVPTTIGVPCGSSHDGNVAIVERPGFTPSAVIPDIPSRPQLTIRRLQYKHFKA